MKKYRFLKEKCADLLQKLEQNPVMGDPLGYDCYKVQLAIAAKGKGKSGGARVITLVLQTAATVSCSPSTTKANRTILPMQNWKL